MYIYDLIFKKTKDIVDSKTCLTKFQVDSGNEEIDFDTEVEELDEETKENLKKHVEDY